MKQESSSPHALLPGTPGEFRYDGSLDGFFTAVFDLYSQKAFSAQIVRQDAQPPLFGQSYAVITDPVKASRVVSGISRRLGPQAISSLLSVWLSELSTVETILLGYILHAFNTEQSIMRDFSNFYVLELSRIERMISRERHRMKAFIRFSRLKDNLYYALIEPDFNVLPLVIKHFTSRYADQHWLIYDRKRGYGVLYDLHKARIVQPESEMQKDINEFMHDEETEFRKLWQNYFRSVNIKSRKNTKLHLQHVPKRYWHLLTEKF